MAAPPGLKAERWLRNTRLEYGWPLMIAALGGVLWTATRRRDAGTLVLAGWAAVWLVFAVLGIATPVEMRANLAAMPLVLAFGAIALASLGRASANGAALAIMLGAAIAWDGFLQWTRCLTG